VRGVLSLVTAAPACGLAKVVLPAANAAEASILQDLEILPMSTLLETVAYFRGRLTPRPQAFDASRLSVPQAREGVDFSDVRGQAHAKRALEVAAAGGHNLLLIGPPGGGKTMLARRQPTILPPLTLEESLEITRIYSICGLLTSEASLIAQRPFRSPHHTVSDVALIGGGTFPRPGEVSLAHHGVLFLDELPEFSKNALEVLRQPLEEASVTIARASAVIRYPARFTLLAAMNPCPCGHYTDPSKECTCSATQIQKYLGRISGPLLDRIDLHLEVPAVKYQDLAAESEPESSEAIRQRVLAARELQRVRFRGQAGIHLNAHMGPRLLREHCRLGSKGHEWLRTAIDRLGLSARAYHRVLKVSRTIADLAGAEAIAPEHVREAIQYRSLDRRFWGKLAMVQA